MSCVVLVTTFAPFHRLVIKSWSYLELDIGRFDRFRPFLTPFSAFGELVHAVNIDEAETIWPHMMFLYTRERAVTAKKERLALCITYERWG